MIFSEDQQWDSELCELDYSIKYMNAYETRRFYIMTLAFYLNVSGYYAPM